MAEANEPIIKFRVNNLPFRFTINEFMALREAFNSTFAKINKDIKYDAEATLNTSLNLSRNELRTVFKWYSAHNNLELHHFTEGIDRELGNKIEDYLKL